MSRYFFVDYENVGSLSLMGIEKLCSDDKLIVVLSDNATNRINIDLVKKLAKAIPMKIAINKVARHDAADFRLIAEIGICMRYIRKSKDEIYVLTEDKGFDAAIEGFKVAGYSIKRTNSIANACGCKTDHKKLFQQLTARIYRYNLVVAQFNEYSGEAEVYNQKALIRIIYLMYMASSSIDKFQRSLIEAGFNGYVINSLTYIIKELIYEGIY